MLHPMNFSRSQTVVFCCLLSVMICFPACQKPAEKKQNELVIGLSARPKTLDPRLSTDVSSARVQQLIYNSLLKKDIHSDLIPDLAESWEIVDDTSYRFFLRKNVMFHDGTELTATDVKATYDAIMNEKLASLRRGAFEKISSMEIEDPYTIVFRTKAPFAPLLINLVQGILPASQASILDKSHDIQPVGTGPFQLENREGEDLIVLRAFESCFDGRPKLDRVTLRVVPDDTIRLMGLEKGSIDFLQNNVPPDALARIASDERFLIMSEPGTSYYYLGFNFRIDYPPKAVEVRRSLALALNREEIIHHLLGDNAKPATAVLPGGHWAFNPEIRQIEYDPGAAAGMLDKAGWPLHDGTRFTVHFKCSQNKQSRRLAEVIQAQWGKIGVKVEIQSLEWGTFYDDIIKGNFEAYILSWVGVTDPDIYFSLFHSSSVPPNGRNRGQYNSPQMDRLLEQGRSTLDKDKRAEIYRNVQALAAEDLPYINLWHTNNIAVMKRDLCGYRLYPAGDFETIPDLAWVPGD
jgi:ABC-type transport system substrate-binding protein